MQFKVNLFIFLIILDNVINLRIEQFNGLSISTFKNDVILLIDQITKNILKNHSIFLLLSFNIEVLPYTISSSIVSFVKSSTDKISFNILK